MGTTLSIALAEERYQQSIDFRYDVARPSFNGFPSFFKKTGYVPSKNIIGPFQAAHGTELSFFDWLSVMPRHQAEFDAFMAAYRAGKANWYDPGFYPVADRLIDGFDPRNNNVLLVDVGGGRGHDVQLFATQYPFHPGKIVLQDQESVIASIQDKDKLSYECEAHDFSPINRSKVREHTRYIPSSTIGTTKKGSRFSRTLRSALKPGYSRVLLNEIILSQENPTFAAASMDMMMLAHFNVRERTEADWRAILAQAGLKFLQNYQYPGVAESVIEAELSVDED